jgi:hypothetical protein
VASVRKHFLDLLTATELETLSQVAERVVDHLSDVDHRP